MIYSLWHFLLQPDVPKSINMYDYRRKSIGSEIHPMDGDEGQRRIGMAGIVDLTLRATAENLLQT